MKSALIGYTGFIGGNIAEQHRFTDHYNSQNIEDIRGKKYDLIVSAGTSAERWKANLQPKKDWQKIKNLLDNLKLVKATHFVLISTVDVYPNSTATPENLPIKETEIKQAYGRNRFRMEKVIRSQFPKVTILRLPQTFGPRLKKNFLYDLIHDNTLDFTHKDSQLQFYNLKNIWKDISAAITQKRSILNLAVEPVTASEVAKFCLKLNFTNVTKNPPLIYNMTTKYGKYLYRKPIVLKEIKTFILSERSKNKIAISNLAWETKDDDKVWPTLKKYQICGLEVAPAKIGNVKKYRDYWQQAGVSIVAVTSLLYGHPELTLFETKTKRQKTLNYLKRMIKLTSDLGAKVMVFGSPKNRLIHALPQEKANQIAVSFFKAVGQVAKKYDINFCLEPVPTIYDADYLNTTGETIDLVKRIDHPNIKINLDIGAMKINSENMEKTFKKVLPYLGHIHLSEKGFGPTINPKSGYRKIAKLIKKYKYAGWISIEMWNKNDGQTITNIEKSLKYIKTIYA